ncbi:MAG: hypothetical protein ACKO6L_09135, partial [Flavobacteriales bacterium]
KRVPCHGQGFPLKKKLANSSKSAKGSNEINEIGCVKYRIGIFLAVISTSMFGQSNTPIVADTSSITLLGEVRDERDQPVTNIIVLNNRTRKGLFGKPDGTFQTTCRRSDTLSITSLGYSTRTICFKDSLVNDTFRFRIYLDTRYDVMPTLVFFGERDLEEIQKDIASLGYNEDDYMLSGINAAISPITFLYQQFSKKERSKRQVAIMENEDRKRELLKELFKHYVDYEIITLNDDQFDDFIDYLNVSDEFMRSSSQYDFLLYVKDKFQDYRIWMRNHTPMKSDDFNYDQD